MFYMCHDAFRFYLFHFPSSINVFILNILYRFLATLHSCLGILPHLRRVEEFYRIVIQCDLSLVLFLCPFPFRLQTFCLLPDSALRRLHPRELRHHPVTWIPGLLPPQPELHLGNRDLSRQRLAGDRGVDTCSSQIQFPSQSYAPAAAPQSPPLSFPSLPSPPCCRAAFWITSNQLSLGHWSADSLARGCRRHRMPPHTRHRSKCNYVNWAQQLYLSDAHWKDDLPLARWWEIFFRFTLKRK